MTTDIIFLGIITVFCVIGAKRGFIKNVGSLLSVMVSWILSRVLATSISTQILIHFNIGSYIDGVLSAFNSGLTDYGNIVVNGIPCIQMPNISGLGFVQAVSSAMNVSAAHICNMGVTLLLFSLCMIICGLVVRAFHTVFEKLPLGKTVNIVLGGVCGVMKGLIIAVLIYWVMYIVNIIFHTNIPLNGILTDRLFEFISQIHF